MNLQTLVDRIKAHPDYPKAGMILAHNGVVRENSREGDPVTGLSLTVDHKRLEEILTQQKARPGIIEILVHIEEDKPLDVGDDVMYLVVAGDIRENVLECLTDTLNLIKAEVTQKTQFYKDK
ncbi:MAG: molybdenum cofactor biosynthesis protein MoaE [Desulfobacterales bacterium]|nr:molybdenum cofactor biosynthesis protein MoaE [Desulfobacterales bacterium]